MTIWISNRYFAMKINDNPNAAATRSQTRAILAYMREGHAITPGDARRLFGCDRLSGRIMDIEKLVGYKPPRKLVEVRGQNADGEPVTKRVMSYWLHDES